MKTAATSLASNRGIKAVSGSAFWPVFASYECKNATQGRTTSSFLAKLVGSSHICSILNGGNIGSPIFGRPISSEASRRAVSKAASASESALPIMEGEF